LGVVREKRRIGRERERERERDRKSRRERGHYFAKRTFALGRAFNSVDHFKFDRDTTELLLLELTSRPHMTRESLEIYKYTTEIERKLKPAFIK